MKNGCPASSTARVMAVQFRRKPAFSRALRSDPAQAAARKKTNSFSAIKFWRRRVCRDGTNDGDDDAVSGTASVFGRVGVNDAGNIAGELDHHMPKPATRPQEWNPPFPGEANQRQHFFKRSVRTALFRLRGWNPDAIRSGMKQRRQQGKFHAVVTNDGDWRG